LPLLLIDSHLLDLFEKNVLVYSQNLFSAFQPPVFNIVILEYTFVNNENRILAIKTTEVHN